MKRNQPACQPRSNIQPISTFAGAFRQSLVMLETPVDSPKEVVDIIRNIDRHMHTVIMENLRKNVPLDPEHKQQLLGTIDNLRKLVYDDPGAYCTTLPADVPNWSISMLAWLAMAKATCVRYKLYRLHPCYRVRALYSNHPLKDRSCAFLFGRLYQREKKKGRHGDWPRGEIDYKAYEMTGSDHMPFVPPFMCALSDSEYLRACGAVRSTKPVLLLTLTELSMQLRSLSHAWTENLRMHGDVKAALFLLECRAMTLASMTWGAEVLDVPPLTAGSNITTGGVSDDGALFGLTREVQKDGDGSDGAGEKGMRTTSHRFVYEMHKFFMNTKMCLSLYERHPHMRVSVLGIPGWKEDEHGAVLSMGEHWKRFNDEMDHYERGTTGSESARDSMAKLMMVFKARPCELDFYMKNLKVGRVTAKAAMYEFRPGEVVNRIGLSFDRNWISLHAKEENAVPNPMYAWKTIAPCKDTDAHQANRVTMERCTEKVVIDCKVAGSMINAYLPAESYKSINWEKDFFICQADAVLNPEECLNPTGFRVMPKIVYIMGRFYVYVNLVTKGRIRPYYIDAVDVKTAVFVWIYLIHNYHQGMLFEKHDLSRLTSMVFAGGSNMRFAPKAALTSVMTEGTGDRARKPEEVMAAIY